MVEGKCAIWGTPASTRIFSEISEWDSPRAGGAYRISREQLEDIPFDRLNDAQRALMTTWLVDQRLSGEKCPNITIEVFRDVINRNLLQTTERLARFFTYCSIFKNRLGDKVFWSYFEWTISGAELKPDDLIAMAYCELKDRSEINVFLRLLQGLQYLDDYELTFKAFERIDELKNSNFNSRQAFVAMWFNPDDDNLFKSVIRPAIEIGPDGRGTGFKAFRVDKEHHADFIMDFMIGNIKRSKFMVADFTSFMVKGHKVLDGKALSVETEDFQISRGGVYFEAGFARGLGIPVIATCHKSQISHIHFDLKQFNTIYWDDVAELRKLLSERIFGMFVT